jgi:hypothetical protein
MGAGSSRTERLAWEKLGSLEWLLLPLCLPKEVLEEFLRRK